MWVCRDIILGVGGEDRISQAVCGSFCHWIAERSFIKE